MTGASRPMRVEYLELLRCRDFGLLWTGQFVSYLGDRIFMITTPLLVLALTGSAISMSIMMAISFMVSVLFGLPVGGLVDRIDRRRGMIACDMIRAVLVALIPHTTELWQIYVLAGLISLVGLFYVPARQAALPNLVDKQRLVHANSLVNVGFNFGILCGPAIGGVLAAACGFSFALYLDSATFLFSAIMIALIRQPLSQGGRRPSGSGELMEGLRFIGRNQPMWRLVTVLFVCSVGWSAFSVLYALVPARVLLRPDVGYAMIMTGVGAGQLAGALLTPFLARRFRLFWLAAVSILVSGVWHVAFGFSLTLTMAVATVLLATLADGVVIIVVDTMLQQAIPDSLRGRVLGALSMLRGCCTTLGMGGGGAMAEHFGVRPTAFAGGVFIAGAGLFAMFAWRDTEVRTAG